MTIKDLIIILVISVIVVAVVVAFLIPAVQRARLEANRSVSETRIKGIDTTCYLYAQAHNGQWPDSLEVLVEQDYLPAESLVNPNRPELKVGYVYIKPARPPDELPNGIMLFYEAYEKWGEGVQTGVEFITDEAEFKKLLAEAEKYAASEGDGD
ncbi:MAG: hypothetical protein KAT11_05930 [Phycisphaerae bacterium]|nr:hypothetical protein [Phycisphaerae bacterium]